MRKARQQLGNLKLKDDKGAVLTHPLFQSPHQQTAEEIAAKRARVAERERVKFRNEKRVMVEKGALVKREQNLFELGMSRFKALNPDMVIDMEASKKRNDEKINAMVVEKYGRDWLTKHDTKVEK